MCSVLQPRCDLLDALQEPIGFLHHCILLEVLESSEGDAWACQLEIIVIAAQVNRGDAVDVACLVEHEHDVRESLLRDLEVRRRELREIRLVVVKVLIQEREYLINQLEVCRDVLSSFAQA